MRWIYISPHLDDAVLSAGGLLFEQARAGHSIEIWNIFGGIPSSHELSPLAQILHEQWDIPAVSDLVYARRKEDQIACQIVGAVPVYFDFNDCIYRRGEHGEWLYGDIFIPPHPQEENLPSEIAQAMLKRLNPTDQLVCPLGLGSHVDHVLVRRAAEQLERPLIYYVDIPYLFKSPELKISGMTGMKETVHRVGEAGLRAWHEAIVAYASQVPSLFEGLDAMRQQIRHYWSEKEGIGLWSV